MIPPGVLARLPSDFGTALGRRGVLAARRELLEGFVRMGFGPDDRALAPPSDLAGRRELGGLELGGERFVVRRFRHGGLLRGVTGGRFADLGRPFDELLLARALRERGLPTPEVVALRAQRAYPGLPGWRLELVTRRLEDTVQLSEFLERARGGGLAAPLRHALTRAVGELVGRLHAAGLEHADLTPRNLLVDEDPEPPRPRVWVIDLDRSRLVDALDDLARRRNLARLLRVTRRIESWGTPFLTRADFGRFLVAYAGPLDRGRAGRLADAHAVRGLHESGRAWHRAWWRVEGLFGGGPAARDRVPGAPGGENGVSP